MPTKQKPIPRSYGETLGIYFGENEFAEYNEIKQEAEKVRMKPSEYARRLLRVARKAVAKDPGLLLNA